MKTANIALVVALVAIVIAGGAYFGIGKNAKLTGSTACSGITCLSGGLRLVADAGGDFESDVAVLLSSTFKVGTSGTAQSNQVSITCSPKLDASINATTTGYGFCTGVTGVTSSDFVFAEFATSTVGSTVAADNFAIVSAKASTTAGAIDFIIANNSGKNAVPSAVGRVGSTTVIWASH